ncbi:hypothetical protein [Pseudoduganella violacea]|uniref:Uncharacterized protein n=1 Tax=Pseudoduganella violacea TaxID=1715466 RepID=A0A7W5B8A7_9BURK|nr:hypothetical protein [Pseudoduganella violacea]MBB3118374.1 hypothetical protein [Pseudoduganella violacea]
MKADNFPPLVLASASAPGANLIAAAPTMEDLAATQRYDIRTAAGITLWREITLTDVPRLIKLRRELPDLYPEWQQDLVAHPLREGPLQASSQAPRDGLTVASLAGQVEPLVYAGGSLGLNLGTIEIYVHTPTRAADVSLSAALQHLDLFEPVSRTHLVLQVEWWFDVKLNRGVA